MFGKVMSTVSDNLMDGVTYHFLSFGSGEEKNIEGDILCWA